MLQSVCENHEWIETKVTSTNGALSIVTQCKNCGGFLVPIPQDTIVRALRKIVLGKPVYGDHPYRDIAGEALEEWENKKHTEIDIDYKSLYEQTLRDLNEAKAEIIRRDHLDEILQEPENDL